MTNRKSTRRALMMSAISLVLCISMLVGTTFAWFTDEVKSGVNQIVAGNLDVDVLTADGNSIKDVTTLFDDVNGEPILWEPGAVAYEKLTVVNLGNLALKYQMSLNFTNEVKYNGKGLSDVLKVAVVDAGTLTSREAALAAAKAAGGALLKDFSLPGDLEKGQNDTYGIVIYWEPGENDNDFNMNNGIETVLSIDLGINLVATQLTSEEDSFDNMYDELADATEVDTLDELTAALENGGKVVLNSNISTGYGYVTIPEDKNVVLYLNGNTISSEGEYTAIENQGTLTITGNGKIDAGWNAVWNNGGTLVVNGGTLEGDNSAVYSEGGSVTINGGNLAVTADNGYNAAVYVAEGANLIINGGTISTAIANTRVLDARNSSTVKINDGTFNGTKSDAYEMGDIYVGDCQDENSFVIDGGVFNCTVSTNYKLTVNGGTFNGQIYTGSIVPADYTLTINNGTFNLETEQIKVGGNGWKFQINDGTFAATKENVYVEHTNAGSGTATINGGTFAKSPSGMVSYRAYVLNSGSRQAIQIDMEQIYAKKSLVVELWHEDTLLTTTTYLGSYPYDAPGYTTCCVALTGGFVSWDTTISEGVILSDTNVPDTIKVYADGILTHTFTHDSGTVLADKVNDYLALSSVQKTATTTE